MRFLALDQSSEKMAFSVFSDEKLIAYKGYDFSKILNEKNNDVVRRINLVKKYMEVWIKKYEIEFVALEDIYLSGKWGFSSFKVLSNLLGVLLDRLYEMQFLYTLVKASEWKKTCGVKGKKSEEQKANAIKFVKEEYGLDVNSDIADSICIGHHVARKIIPKITTVHK